MTEFLDCPFCGSSDLAVTLSITCKGCGARCAKVYWNKRSHRADLDFVSELIAENNELKSRQAAAPQGREALERIIEIDQHECKILVEYDTAGNTYRIDTLDGPCATVARAALAVTHAVAPGTGELRDALIAARPHVQEMSLRLPTDSAIDCARTLDQIDAALAQAQEPGEDKR